MKVLPNSFHFNAQGFGVRLTQHNKQYYRLERHT